MMLMLMMAMAPDLAQLLPLIFVTMTGAARHIGNASFIGWRM
jgi:hypothetical protein